MYLIVRIQAIPCQLATLPGTVLKMLNVLASLHSPVFHCQSGTDISESSHLDFSQGIQIEKVAWLKAP